MTALKIFGTFALMMVCGAIAFCAATTFLMNLGLKLHDNYEYYGGYPGLAFVLGIAAVGFLSPAILIWYLRKRSYQVSLRMMFTAMLVVAVILGIYCLSL